MDLRAGTGRTDVGLPAALAGLRQAHPGVTIHLRHTAAPALARAVADAELDIAFVDGPVDTGRLTRIELGRHGLVLAVAPDDPLAGRAGIGLGDPALAGRDFVAYRADSALEAQIETACAEAGPARRVACEAENVQYLVEIVRHGGGVAVLPPASLDSATGPVAAVPIVPPLYRVICAVIARGRPPTAAAAALVDLLGPPGTAE